jgi:hypothetical protein
MDNVAEVSHTDEQRWRYKLLLIKATDDEIAVLIDHSSHNSTLSFHHSWYRDRWHQMDFCNKIEWVRSRRDKIINILSEASDDVAFAYSLQEIDQDFALLH